MRIIRKEMVAQVFHLLLRTTAKQIIRIKIKQTSRFLCGFFSVFSGFLAFGDFDATKFTFNEKPNTL